MGGAQTASMARPACGNSTNGLRLAMAQETDGGPRASIGRRWVQWRRWHARTRDRDEEARARSRRVCQGMIA